MKCYVHIGTEKTGSTTLQCFFNANKKELSKLGFYIFKNSGVKNDWLFSVSCYNYNRRNGSTVSLGLDSDDKLERFSEATVSAMRNEISKINNHIGLFSCEDFHASLTTKNEVLRFKNILNSFGYTDIVIVVYLRSPSLLANSKYCELVKGGSIEAEPPQPEVFNHLCDHRHTLELWGEVFGVNNLVPRVFEKNKLFKGSVIDDFLCAIKVKLNNKFYINEDTNSAVSGFGISVLRCTNQYIPAFTGEYLDRAGIDRAIVPDFIKSTRNLKRVGLVEFIDEHFPGERYIMSDALFENYHETYIESNEWVRDRWFPELDHLFSFEPICNTKSSLGFSERDLDCVSSALSSLWLQLPDKNRLTKYQMVKSFFKKLL